MATRTDIRHPLLPDWMAALLKRRAIEGLGLFLILISLAVLAALVSFDPLDPSWSVATAGPIRNMIGLPGAYFADITLQLIGLAGALTVPILAAWGWRIMSDQHLKRPILRVAAAILAVFFAAAAMGGLPTAESWPFQIGMGGFVGDIVLGTVLSWFAALTLPVMDSWVAIGLGLVSFALIAFVLGFSLAEWIMAFRNLRQGAHYARTAADPTAIKGAVTAAKEAVLSRTLGGRAEPTLLPRVKPEGPPREAPKVKRALKTDRVEGREKAQESRRARKERQITLDLPRNSDEYVLPPLDILEESDNSATVHENQDALEQNARLLEGVLEDFGVRGEIVKVRPGPVVTLYELEPAPGTKTSRVIGLADDIARSMSAISVRIATVPGRNVIGIEMPNGDRELVGLREVLASRTFEDSKHKLPMVLGKDIGGTPEIADLATMPHLLIAGTTGSGKSVGLNAMILSLLYRLPPDRCKFIMVDPKMLELSVYDDIPHLLAPVVTDPKKAVVALKWTVREMEDRYRAMSKLGVRNIDGYNKRVAEAAKKGEELTRKVQTGFDPETGRPIIEEEPLDLTPFPYIVVVVDEMADLMLVAGKEIEASIQRLAQMARAAGIHLIMATQRPSVDVITGTIKANFPVRISFMVTSKIDSRTILGEQGAEQLLGRGDMLYMAGGGRIKRVHGPFVDDTEVEGVCDFLRSQAQPDYVEAVTDENDMSGGFDTDVSGAASIGESDNPEDALYDQAVALVAREGKASTSFVQRHLQIGYNRAARIIERMEKEGVVGQANHVGKREVLVGDHSVR